MCRQLKSQGAVMWVVFIWFVTCDYFYACVNKATVSMPFSEPPEKGCPGTMAASCVPLPKLAYPLSFVQFQSPHVVISYVYMRQTALFVMGTCQ